MYNGVHFSSGPDPENVRTIDHSCLPYIHSMHKNGIRIDIPFLRNLDSRILTKQRDLESSLPSLIGNTYTDFDGKKHSPFNIGSPDHVARLLFKHLQLAQPGEVKLTKTGKRETVDDDVLSLLKSRHPVVPVISDWRELNKLHTTYTGPDCLESFAIDDVIHTEFTVTVAATGRLSSRRPNCQNIPTRTDLGKEVRNAFIAFPGFVLVSNDLSQIEMRWAAHRSQDPVMMKVFWDQEDVHTRTTCNVFHLDYANVMRIAKSVDAGTATKEDADWYKKFKQEMRLPCKTVGFGVLYGQTPEGLQATLAAEGVFWTIEQCTNLIEHEFFAVYAKLKEMLDRDHRTVLRYALIWDDFGRVRLVPEAKSVHRWIREEGTRKAGNHPEQSGAQNGLKLAMAKSIDVLIPDFGFDCVKPALQIHDELITNVKREYAEQFAFEQSEVMRKAVQLRVPVESSSDIAERWGELK